MTYAIRLYQRFGFETEGRKREAAVKAGPLAPAGLFFLHSVLHPASVVTPGQLHNGI